MKKCKMKFYGEMHSYYETPGLIARIDKTSELIVAENNESMIRMFKILTSNTFASYSINLPGRDD